MLVRDHFFQCLANRYGVLCKGHQPRQKMVTNSFGKRNFMQPMGRPKHALKVPCFFPIKFGGRWQRRGIIFPWFPMGSHQVPKGFLKFSMCSPTCSPQHLTFISYALAKLLSSFPPIVEELYTSKQNLPFGEPPQFLFFFFN